MEVEKNRQQFAEKDILISQTFSKSHQYWKRTHCPAIEKHKINIESVLYTHPIAAAR